MKHIRIGVIAAAGKGTRAYPRTTYIPKPLFIIEGKSILQRNIELLQEKFQLQKIYIIVGHLKEAVLEEIERIQFFNKKLPELIPSLWTTKGLAADIASLKDKIQEHFITVLGDEFYFKSTHENFLKTLHKHPQLAASIGVQRTSIASRIRKNYSVEMDKDKITNLVEKPTHPPNDLLGLGSYLFTPEYFNFFELTHPSPRTGVVEITDVIDKMAKESSGGVYATPMDCVYFNINSMQDYHHAVYEVRNAKFNEFKTTVIIPTYNNEWSLSDVLVDFQKMASEVLVVDAGSHDKTTSIAKKSKAKVVSLQESQKLNSQSNQLPSQEEFLGDLIRLGIQNSKGDIIIVVSPDGTFRSKDYPKILEYLKDSDMVIGTRTTRQMIEQGSNLKPLPRLINLIMGKLVEIFWWGQEPRFTDVDCHYFGMWKDSYLKIQDQMNEKGKYFIVELMIEFTRSHMRCIEIPVSYFKPVVEEKYSLRKFFRDAWNIFFLILKKKFQSF